MVRKLVVRVTSIGNQSQRSQVCFQVGVRLMGRLCPRGDPLIPISGLPVDEWPLALAHSRRSPSVMACQITKATGDYRRVDAVWVL